MKKNLRLKSLKPLDIESCKDISELLNSMSRTSFGAREVGRAFSVLKEVARDPQCGLILTISGALTIAKLGRVFGSLISRSIVQAVITTGAVVTHSLVEEIGMAHYEAPENLSDEQLYKLNLNRIHDSIEPESNLNALEELAFRSYSGLDSKVTYGSYEIIRHLSTETLRKKASKGLLGSALKHNVNVYVPALTDSELGLYLFRYIKYRRSSKQKEMIYNPLRDLEEYANWICSKKRIAFLTLGGGVPRNWGQQMLPFLLSDNKRNISASGAHLPKVIAGIRICPDSVGLGHLSGSTYSEGITWGKFDARNKENFIEVNCDATIIFPILVKALIDHVDQR